MKPQPFFTTDIRTYFGGKNASGAVHVIINHIPKHTVFISGFLGNCAVFRYKKPAQMSIGIDADPDIIAAWQHNAKPNQVAFFNGDFLRIPTEALNLKHDTFVYLDPPYYPDTRTSRHRYAHELTHEQHVQLLAKANTMPGMVAIICYDNPLYQDWLKGWNKINFTSQTRGGLRLETLYFNYAPPSPEDLHDIRFLGTDYRDREKSKRRLDTIIKKVSFIWEH